MKLRLVAIVPLAALISACGGTDAPESVSGVVDVSAVVPGEASAGTPGGQFIESIRASGITNTTDAVVLELGASTCATWAKVPEGQGSDLVTRLLAMNPKYLDGGTEDTFVQIALDQFCETLPQSAGDS